MVRFNRPINLPRVRRLFVVFAELELSHARPTVHYVCRRLVRGSKAASLLGRYNDALAKFFSENPNYAGDESLLEPFHGKRVGGLELLTDPKKLWELYEPGELRIGDDLYAAPSGGGE
jgi:hypothetical protein